MALQNVASSIAATIITDAAKDVYKKGKETVSAVATGAWDAGSGRNPTSLTEFTKSTTLRSRIYIDGSLAADPVVPNIVRAMHTLYTGLILTALQLNQFVTQGKTVQDFVGTVATEDVAPYRDVHSDLRSLTASLEVIDDKVMREAAEKRLRDAANPDLIDEKDLKAEVDRRYRAAVHDLGREKSPPPPPKPDKFTATDIRVAPPQIAAVGKLIEVTLTNPEQPTKDAKLLLAVQMVPYIVPAQLASMFINKDTSLGFLRRLLQWRAGEIAFWRDLIFQVDRINKSHQISKTDTSGVFYDFMRQIAKKDHANISKNLAQPAASRSHNLANSVMIFSTDTVARAKAESGIDLHVREARDRYFRDTYSMAIVVVDTLYNHVTLYLNGIEDVGVYSFSQFDPPRESENGGGIDLLKALAQFTAGKAPRF